MATTFISATAQAKYNAHSLNAYGSASGGISNATYTPNNTISLTDTSIITIGDFTITGKDLRTSLTILQRIIAENYPEELI